MLNSFIKYIVLIFFISSSAFAHSPKIFAHRGGGKEFPENTILAFEESIKAGADGIELDVQVTKDKLVVLYHPRYINEKAAVSDFNYVALQKINPQIPTLEEVIDKFPNAEIIVDLKSLPKEDLIDSVIKLVDKKNAWSRLIFYSTNDEHIEYLKQKKPNAMVFESRKLTRERLLKMRNEDTCCCIDKTSQYAGFELNREMIVEESFVLGKSNNKISFKLWDPKAMQCFNNSLQNPARIFLFGINNKKDYEEAKDLGAYAVFTDRPKALIELIK
ncbi:MAG: glycerophosphodiester phosphodiesterase family protein [Pseudomonadota bacterium]